MKIILILILLCTQIGCATAVDLAVQSVAGAVGGAIGNMADRRMERALGNVPAKEDEMLEPKLKREKDYDCKNCEVNERRRTNWGI